MGRMNVAAAAPEAYKAFIAAETAIRKGPLDATVRELVKIRASQMNGCLLCIDMHTTEALEKGETAQRIFNLDAWRESKLFTEAERAALAYVEEATRHKHVSDATFAELRRHFDEREIVEITWLNALENYYNLLNLPLEIESDGLCAIAQRRAA
jgi:AhpD family alkylhydroperoxidase